MTSLKLLSAALFATAVIAAPAMAREHHVRHVTSDFAVAAPEAVLTGPAYAYGYHCVPAPRVGAFASAPWEMSVPCEPGHGPRAYY